MQSHHLPLAPHLSSVPNRERGRKGSERSYLLENDELYELEYNNVVGSMGTYCFQSLSWSRSNLRMIELTKIHRQSDSDDGLLELLNAMREGDKPLEPKHSAAVNAIKAPLRSNAEGIEPTQLHSKNNDVSEVNKSELGKLPGPTVTFKSNDTVEFHPIYKDKLVKKYSLERISHLPQIWSSVEGITYPSRLHEAKSELQSSKMKKEALIRDRKYGEIAEVDEHIDTLEAEITDIQNTAKRNFELNPENVSCWLKDAGVVGDSRDFFDRLTRFEEQLLRDFGTLNEHANERFFGKECRVDESFDLKEKSQVMLLYNLDILGKLANGSRGVVEGFVETQEYKALIKEIMDKREKSNTGEDKLIEEDRDINMEDAGGAPDVSVGISNEAKQVDKGTESNESDARKDDNLLSIIKTLKSDVARALIERLNGMHFINDELTKVERALAANMQKLPIVKFLEGQLRVVNPEAFKKEFKGCGEAQRWQIPLTLAWAISIHKRYVQAFGQC